MAEFHRHIRISAVLSEVAAACDFVVAAASEAGLNEKALHHCRLAVDEACTNVIEHGYPSAAVSPVIDISVDVSPGAILITLCDDSPQFDPLSHPDPDPQAFLADLNPGGWGVFFIRKVMDRVVYSFESGRNCLSMTKLITADTVSPAPQVQIGEETFANKTIQLTPAGRLDVVSSTVLAKRLNELIDDGVRNFVINLKKTDYISSGALKMLVGMWQRARELKGDVVLAEVHEQARDVLAATGLDLVFVVVTSGDEAALHFRHRTSR